MQKSNFYEVNTSPYSFLFRSVPIDGKIVLANKKLRTKFRVPFHIFFFSLHNLIKWHTKKILYMLLSWSHCRRHCSPKPVWWGWNRWEQTDVANFWFQLYDFGTEQGYYLEVRALTPFIRTYGFPEYTLRFRATRNSSPPLIRRKIAAPPPSVYRIAFVRGNK